MMGLSTSTCIGDTGNLSLPRFLPHSVVVEYPGGPHLRLYIAMCKPWYPGDPVPKELDTTEVRE